MAKKSASTASADEREQWNRFERAVDAAVKSGPKHKPAPANSKRPTSDAPSKRKKRAPSP